MKEGGKILAEILRYTGSLVKPGVSVYFLNEEAERLATLHKAKPAFKHYRVRGLTPYPCGLCVSLNEEVVHGFGSRQIVLKEGDMLGLDMGLEYKGRFTDHAITVPVGEVGKETKKLIRITEEALYQGIKQVAPGKPLVNVSRAVQEYVEKNGFSIVKQLVGHGVGFAVHEDPPVPNFVEPGWFQPFTMEKGLVIAIEPMVTAGSWQVCTDKDGWTVRTCDGSLAAHFEHTVAVTEGGYEIITK